MTAPVGREVERKLSKVGRVSTGLRGQKTLEAGSKDLADFGDPGARIALGRKGRVRKLAPVHSLSNTTPQFQKEDRPEEESTQADTIAKLRLIERVLTSRGSYSTNRIGTR